MYVKRDAPNWDEVAKVVGRDKKVSGTTGLASILMR